MYGKCVFCERVIYQLVILCVTRLYSKFWPSVMHLGTAKNSLRIERLADGNRWRTRDRHTSLYFPMKVSFSEATMCNWCATKSFATVRLRLRAVKYNHKARVLLQSTCRKWRRLKRTFCTVRLIVTPADTQCDRLISGFWLVRCPHWFAFLVIERLHLQIIATK